MKGVKTMWFLIEDCTSKRSAVYETLLNADNADEAIEEADCIFGRLTVRDKRDRDDVYIIKADLDEDGCIDYNTADNYMQLWGRNK